MFYIALIIVIILLILDKYVSSYKDNFALPNKTNTNTYTKKEYLLTQSELKFYKLLKQITDKLELNLFCQVPMYELINCKDRKDFNRIRSKSIDFVITEKNCKIKLCIELDDYTHNKKSRMQRDIFVNKVFEKVETKLLRIKVQNYYNMEELERLIKDSI